MHLKEERNQVELEWKKKEQNHQTLDMQFSMTNKELRLTKKKA
jgi:hypothetical protein